MHRGLWERVFLSDDDGEIDHALHELRVDDLLMEASTFTQGGVDHRVHRRIDALGTGSISVSRDGCERRCTILLEAGSPTHLRKVVRPWPNGGGQLDRNLLSRRVSVCLVNLSSTEYPVLTAPLALTTLGAHLRKVFGDQVDVEYVDTQLEAPGEVLERVAAARPDVIGISAKVGEASELDASVRDLRELEAPRRPLIVLGNVIPTYAADQILHAHPDVLCVIGRGEIAMTSIVRHLANGDEGPLHRLVPNSASVAGSTIQEVGGAPLDLAEIGVADWRALFHRYPPERYQEIWMEASRGCPQKRGGVGCSFCAIMPNNGSRAWVARPTEAVLEELTVLGELGVPHVRFADEEFMAGHTTDAVVLARALLDLKRRLTARGIAMPSFDFAIRVDDVYRRGHRQTELRAVPGYDEPVSNNGLRRLALETFREAGLTQAYVGLESGSGPQLKRLYKAALPEDNERAVAILRELGIRIAAGWIMIDPLMEQLSDLRENLDFLEDNRLIPTAAEDDFVTNPINRMRVLDGSPYVEILNRRGLLGSRKRNLIEYEFTYSSSRIARIAGVLADWEGRFGPCMYALKTKVGADVLRGTSGVELGALTQHLVHLKQLDFELARRLVDLFDAYEPEAPPWAALDAVVSRSEAARTSVTQRLTRDIREGRIRDDDGTLCTGLQQIGIAVERATA